MPSKVFNRLRHMENGHTSSASSMDSILRDLLLQKGVPSSQVDARVKHALQTLGSKSLKNEVEAKEGDLWGRLKRLADSKDFRWISRDELNSRAKQQSARSKSHLPPLPRRQKVDPWSGGNDPWTNTEASHPTAGPPRALMLKSALKIPTGMRFADLALVISSLV